MPLKMESLLRKQFENFTISKYFLNKYRIPGNIPVLYHTSLCYIIHPYAISYIPIVYHTSLCYIIHPYVISYIPMLCNTSLCYIIHPYAISYIPMLYHTSLCYVIQRMFMYDNISYNINAVR